MEIIETERLVLRRPRVSDEPAVFSRYASDPEVTRYMSFATHRSLDDTHAYVEWSDGCWTRWPQAGPMLIFARDGVTLLGGAGIVNNSETLAQIGYILARDAWGRGYASEALLASVEAARASGVRRLEAGVHVDHHASRRVLEKAGFSHEGMRPGLFPNLPPDVTRDAALYALAL